MGDNFRFGRVAGFSYPRHCHDMTRNRIETSHGTVVIKENWVVLPIGIHFKERMEYGCIIATEDRRALGLMPRYPVYFLDDGVWYEITYESGCAKPVKVDEMTKYGENNAEILSFNGYQFVKDGDKLHQLRPVEWRDQKNPKWIKSDFGFFYLEEYTEIKISGNVVIRFSKDGYEEVTPVNHKAMVNKIVKKLHDDKILLEYVCLKGALRALLPDRTVILGCETLRVCIVEADMITPVHDGGARVLYKVIKDQWDPMATLFVKEYPEEIERIYHEMFQK